MDHTPVRGDEPEILPPGVYVPRVCERPGLDLSSGDVVFVEAPSVPWRLRAWMAVGSTIWSKEPGVSDWVREYQPGRMRNVADFQHTVYFTADYFDGPRVIAAFFVSGREWADPSALRTLVDFSELPTAPVLYIGPWDEKKKSRFLSGGSAIGDFECPGILAWSVSGDETTENREFTRCLRPERG